MLTLGGHSGEHKAASLVGNFGCKIVCRSTPETSEIVCKKWAGDSLQLLANSSTQTSGAAGRNAVVHAFPDSQ